MTAGTLQGVRAVVTGAGSGIGQATSELLAARGAAVALIGRTRDKLARVARGIAERGGRATIHPADVARADEAAGAVAAAVEALGGLQLLVNNAGIYREGPFDSLDDATIHELLDINVKGVVFVTRAALRWLRADGSIVNVASMSAVRSLDQQSLYAASKAAIVHLGASLARELAPRGIRVNTVSPGPTRTPIIRTVLPEEKIPAVERQLEERIPLHRLGEAHEVAEAIAYLATARFATGAHVVLDGGTVL
jgi:NAD(P)-dependent dehydrogenase (short-subunit alcohol dehydrogenase family)